MTAFPIRFSLDLLKPFLTAVTAAIVIIVGSILFQNVKAEYITRSIPLVKGGVPIIGMVFELIGTTTTN